MARRWRSGLLALDRLQPAAGRVLQLRGQDRQLLKPEELLENQAIIRTGSPADFGKSGGKAIAFKPNLLAQSQMARSFDPRPLG